MAKDGEDRRDPGLPQPPPMPLGSTREELLAQHAEARHRRDAAPLGGETHRAAVAEVSRIEIEIARIERAMDPPRV